MDAILFGNGFNLLSKDCPSWQELLTSISDRENSPILNEIPPTLHFFRHIVLRNGIGGCRIARKGN